jgi:hypothetical protein
VAAGADLVIADAYQSHRVSCDVAALWSGEATAPPASAAVGVPFHAPRSVHTPILHGDGITGSSLTCTPGDWRYASAYDFRWLRDGTPVHDGVDHAVVPMDAGHRLSCRVTATGPGGSVVADSAAADRRPDARDRRQRRRRSPRRALR